jgi:hypothetical protein
MPPIIPSDNLDNACTSGDTEQNENINNILSEQIFHIQEDRPRPEPSAPPLPPEYYIEYT